MALLHLPAEILYMISKETIPEGYPCLSLSCKTLYLAARSLLEEYKQVQQWRHFSYGKGIRSSRGWTIRLPIQLIYEIALQPNIARVIETADLSDAPLRPWNIVSIWDSVDKDMEAMITKMFGESSIVRRLRSSLDDDFDWLTATLEPPDLFSQGNLYQGFPNRWYLPDWGNMFVMTLLPNVKKLRLGMSTNKNCRAIDPTLSATSVILDKLFEILADNDVPSGSNATGLSQLRELVHYGSPRFPKYSTLSGFQWLFSLPSLEVCTFHSCVGYPPIENDLSWMGQVRLQSFPGIRELSLSDSVIHEEELYDLTSRMPHLMHFAMEFGRQRPQRGSYYDGKGLHLDRFVASLGSSVGPRLRRLSLTSNNALSWWPAGIRSLLCFPELVEFEADGRLFDAYASDPTTRTIPRLVEILPSSMRRLRISLWRSDSVQRDIDLLALVKGLFEAFRAGHHSRLPDLEVIEVVGTVEAPQRWVRDLTEELSAVPKLQVLFQPGSPPNSCDGQLPG